MMPNGVGCDDGWMVRLLDESLPAWRGRAPRHLYDMISCVLGEGTIFEDARSFWNFPTSVGMELAHNCTWYSYFKQILPSITEPERISSKWIGQA